MNIEMVGFRSIMFLFNGNSAIYMLIHVFKAEILSIIFWSHQIDSVMIYLKCAVHNSLKYTYLQSALDESNTFLSYHGAWEQGKHKQEYFYWNKKIVVYTISTDCFCCLSTKSTKQMGFKLNNWKSAVWPTSTLSIYSAFLAKPTLSWHLKNKLGLWISKQKY